MFLAARIVGRRLKKNQKQVQELHGKATNVAEEVFGGIKTVQLFNAETMEYNRYSKTVGTAHDKEIQVGKPRHCLMVWSMLLLMLLYSLFWDTVAR